MQCRNYSIKIEDTYIILCILLLVYRHDRNYNENSPKNVAMVTIDSFLRRRFPNSAEFPKRIVRLNLSEGIRDMGIRFPISSSVISGWTNQSSHSLILPPLFLALSLSSATRTTLRKCIIELASGCAPLTPGCWKREGR